MILAPIAILLLFVGFGAIVGLIVLLVNPRTRPVGLGILAALLLLVVLGWFWRAPSSAPMPSDVAAGRQTSSVTTRSVPVAPDAIGSSRERGSAADKAAPHGGVLSALGHALADLFPHGGKSPPPSPSRPLAASHPSPAAEPVGARPDWVDAAPHYADNAYVMPIAVGPYTTRLECEAVLPEALQQAVAKYVELYLGPEAAQRARLTFVREQLVRQEWEETVETSVGRMVVLHLELRFTTWMQDAIRDALRQATAAGRLRVAAIGLGGVLAVLGVLFGYLKLT
jgi:hypothetical protein